jgi:hypothetical protein
MILNRKQHPPVNSRSSQPPCTDRYAFIQTNRHGNSSDAYFNGDSDGSNSYSNIEPNPKPHADDSGSANSHPDGYGKFSAYLIIGHQQLYG